jgi:hypothetical protein
VRVTDGSPLPPSGRSLTSHEESGRGIALVDLLSEAWGVEPAEPGKAVWFRLATPCGLGAGAEPSSTEPRAEGAPDPAANIDLTSTPRRPGAVQTHSARHSLRT